MSHLPVPLSVLNAHCAVLGKTGAGKSSLLRVIVEDLLRRDKRVCVIDPKGDWYGLKLSADGKSAGYPVITFGDFVEDKASDVPINEHSGRHVAELISSGNRPCVIGFRGWMPGKMTKFWIDFASTLFNSKSGELYLIGDEFHNFAPKGRVMDPEAGKSLHWSNRLLSEGRGLGLVILIASQRPQKVHNDTLTCCETLFAMRVVHAADRGAIEDWIDGCGDKEKGALVLNSIASMARGEAFVWCPEHGFGPKRIQFPMFATFDSFAPPQLQKKISAAGWAGVDLDAVKEKLASVIKEVKANDPAELRHQIRELEHNLQSKCRELTRMADRQPEPVKLPAEKVFVVRAEDMETVRDAVHKCENATASCQDIADKISGLATSIGGSRNELCKVLDRLNQIKTNSSVLVRNADHAELRRTKPALMREVKRILRPGRGVVASNGNSSLPVGERKILTACAQFENVTKEELTVLTGFKRSTRDAYIQRMREKGYVEDQGNVVLVTDGGLSALGDFDPLPTGDALREHWMQRLPGGERNILEILVTHYPQWLDRDALEEGTGFKRSTRDAYLQRMKPKRIIEVNRGAVRASPMLFD